MAAPVFPFTNGNVQFIRHLVASQLFVALKFLQTLVRTLRLLFIFPLFETCVSRKFLCPQVLCSWVKQTISLGQLYLRIRFGMGNFAVRQQWVSELTAIYVVYRQSSRIFEVIDSAFAMYQ